MDPEPDAADSTDNGIRLGGAWRNFSQRIRALETENQQLLEQLAGVTADRDSLLEERADMSARFHDSVSSLTQEFSGHLRSLQIIETIRQEKLSLSEKAANLENLCAKLTKDLEGACNEIDICKQEGCSWRSKAAAAEALLEEEKVETKALRDMMYKKDEQIENYNQRVEQQAGDIDTMKRAMATKDRQLVLLVKERDRCKLEIKTISKEKNGKSNAERPEFDLSNLGSLSFCASPSQMSLGSPASGASPRREKSSPRAAPTSPGGYMLASPPLSPHMRSSSFEVNRSFSKSIETSEREYKAIIRKLRAELDEARATIAMSSKGQRKR